MSSIPWTQSTVSPQPRAMSRPHTQRSTHSARIADTDIATPTKRHDAFVSIHLFRLANDATNAHCLVLCKNKLISRACGRMSNLSTTLAGNASRNSTTASPRMGPQSRGVKDTRGFEGLHGSTFAPKSETSKSKSWLERQSAGVPTGFGSGIPSRLTDSSSFAGASPDLTDTIPTTAPTRRRGSRRPTRASATKANDTQRKTCVSVPSSSTHECDRRPSFMDILAEGAMGTTMRALLDEKKRKEQKKKKE